MKASVRAMLFPPPEVGRASTGLTFTDILFGFVISQLFVRLQNWGEIPSYIRWHLIVGATLVLGSWIGFRRSRHRSEYELKFFNLPLFRFILDQFMVVLYFRVAVLTPVTDPQTIPAAELAVSTIALLVYVFGLYVLWDLFGIWMARAKLPKGAGDERPRYPRVTNDGRPSDEADSPNWVGFWISLVVLALLVVLWLVTEAAEPNRLDPARHLIPAVVLLILYRTAKEVRTSWRLF
jgi:hypothetical protein